MSGVYIPGMEMPWCEHQEIDIRRGTDGKWYAIDDDWYEIVPVPDHGRLIDKDVMCKECRRVAEEYEGIYPDCTYCPAHLAPTIIPADKEGRG